MHRSSLHSDPKHCDRRTLPGRAGPGRDAKPVAVERSDAGHRPHGWPAGKVLGPSEVLALQRAVGNAAVSSLLEAARAVPREAAASSAENLRAEPASFAGIPVAPETCEQEHEASRAEGLSDGILTASKLAGMQRLVTLARSPLATSSGMSLHEVLPGAQDSSGAGQEGRGAGSQGRAQPAGQVAAQVRVHTGDRVDGMADQLGAAAFTHGADMFLSRRHWHPRTPEGDRLVHHELAHVAQASREGAGPLRLKRVTKQLNFLVMKRKRIRVLDSGVAGLLGPLGKVNKRLRNWIEKTQAEDPYGHWWTEAGEAQHDPEDPADWKAHQSWGWWPSTGVGFRSTLKLGQAVPGILNRGERLDPHHGDAADEVFCPAMEVDDAEADRDITKRVLASVKRFATSFKGSWNWRFAWGKNCHTFQERMMAALGLRQQKSAFWTHSDGAGTKGGPSGPQWVLSKLYENGAYGKANAIPGLDDGNARLLFAKGIDFADWREAAQDAQVKAAIFNRLGLAGQLAEVMLDSALEKAYGKTAPLGLFHVAPAPAPPALDGIMVRTAIMQSAAWRLGQGHDHQDYAEALPDGLKLADYQALNDEQRARVLGLVGCTADELNWALTVKYALGPKVTIFSDPA